MDEIARIAARLEDGSEHPMDAKLGLARRVVAMYHGFEAADRAEDEFTSVVRERNTPEDMPEVDVTGDLEGQEIWIVRLLSLAGFSSSNREARQLVEQGAVSIDSVRVADPSAQVRPAHGSVLKVGKRRFARITVR